MQYSNFVMLNNVHASLSTALSSVATTVQLTGGQGSRFGSLFPQIATLESFEEGKVVKREIVKITARNGDNLTVVRAFAPCPANDDANSQSQSSVSFNADDTISLLIPKEIFDKIHDAINDIYDNGTNKLRTEVVSGLQIQVNSGPVLVGSAYYDFAGDTITLTDNATNYVEIDEDGILVSNTTGRTDENTKIAMIVTSSGSVTSIADRRLGTIGGKISGINIHELTEKITLVDADEMVASDSENIWNNKKVTVKNLAKYVKKDIEYNVVAGKAFTEMEYGPVGGNSGQSASHTITKSGTYKVTMLFTTYGGKSVNGGLSVNGVATQQTQGPVSGGNHNAPIFISFDIALNENDIVYFVWSINNSSGGGINWAELTYTKDYILN